jgi:predicted CXXCH cytochrome family protein
MSRLIVANPSIRFLRRLIAVLVALSTGLTSLTHADSFSNAECLECHGKESLKSRKGKSLFIDPVKFSGSAHAGIGIKCVSCHDTIREIRKGRVTPHAVDMEPKCAECHEKVSRQYAKSRHAQVSKKICYSCHNPHYSVPYRTLTSEDRKAMCLKCHDAYATHNWLPQKRLHFNYLECASCHDANAEIGAVFYIVERGASTGKTVIDYSRLAPFVDPKKGGLVETVDWDGDGRISAAEIGSFLKRIRENGIPDASLDVRILVLRPAHNFTDKGEQTRDCSLCHSEKASFYSKLVLEVPEKDGDIRTIPADREILGRHETGDLLPDFYLLGESKIHKKDLEYLWEAVSRIGFKWIDLIGVSLVAFCVIAATLHGAMVFSRRRPEWRFGAQIKEHPVPETIWHLVHGLCVIMLILTGIQLRLPDLFPIFATFLNAVNLHNICGWVVLADYVFWLGYEGWRGRLGRAYFVSPRVFFRDLNEMIHYYGYLIFIGAGCPINFDVKGIVESFEKALFFVIMFIVIPAQIFTGILLHDLYRTMPIVETLGGLRFIVALHLVFAYVLVCLIIVHTHFHILKRYA